MTTITQEKVPLYTLPSGHELDLTAYHLDGSRPGPHVHIQASVHGSELQGSLVIFKLLEILKSIDIAGSLTLIPLANPLATNNKLSTFTQGRYSQVSGENWNRLYHDVTPDLDFKSCQQSDNPRDTFKSQLEKTLRVHLNKDDAYGISHDKLGALTLQIMAAKADIVLDLHTGPVATEYLYAPEHLKEQAKDLHFPFQIIIPSKFAGAMDEACFTPWFHMGLDFEAYTLELGSEEVVDSSKTHEQVQKLLNYLKAREILKGDVKPHSPLVQQKLEHFKSYFAPRGGLVEYLKKPGELIKEGEELYLLHIPHQKTQRIRANKDAHIINHGPSTSLIQGSTVYQVLEI